MKANIIKTVDVCCYIAFALLLLLVLGACMSGQVLNGLLFGAIGWVVLCLISGAWFCISQIAEQSQKQTELLRKILDKGV